MARKDVSIVSQFDDICRNFNFLMDSSSQEFQKFALNQEECRKKWLAVEETCVRLQKELNEAHIQRDKLELQIHHVTVLLKEEIRIRQRLQKEEKYLEKKLALVKELVSTDQNIGGEIRDKLVTLSSTESSSRSELESPRDFLMDSVSEIESTRSIISSLDITSERTDEDMEYSLVRSSRNKKMRASTDLLAVPTADRPHRRRSSHENLSVSNEPVLNVPVKEPVTVTKTLASASQPMAIATPTDNSSPIVSQNMMMKKTDTLQGNSPTPKNKLCRRTSSGKKTPRQHNFANKIVLKQEICLPCQHRIRFGKTALKCVDCLGTCHVECKSSMPMPCIPTVRTPTHFVGAIADYSPNTTPMIPALIIHCCNEVELRGLNEPGIYRVSASEKDIHTLKEQLLRGKFQSQLLSSVNIHVVAGALKAFLQTLKEPLVTYTSRESFTKIASISEEMDIQTIVCSLVPDLPQPNRDTLAFLILHLQRVAESPQCKMPISNLAKIFGPMIIGHSRSPPEEGLKRLQEVREQHLTMEKLLNISSDYWSCHGKSIEDSCTPVLKNKRSGKKIGFFPSPHF